MLLTDVFPALAPEVAIGSLFFDVGSTREEVIAAQGPPTYSAHAVVGSSRVEFDNAGRVRAWTNGTPPLNAGTR